MRRVIDAIADVTLAAPLEAVRIDTLTARFLVRRLTRSAPRFLPNREAHRADQQRLVMEHIRKVGAR